jgi:5-(aminomethyl)-3-furanmethanol phosphate kinase
MSKVIERVVIKIGGATLFQPNGFLSELHALLQEYDGSQIWLIVGGGDLIESMRTLHRIYPHLDHEETHWRCVEMLDHTWAIAKQVYGTGVAIESPEELAKYAQDKPTQGLFWVRVQSFYNRASMHLIPNKWQPSSNWNTTTDTLAWLLGKTIHADRVLLIKQCACDPNWTMSEAAKLGVIDSELARLLEANTSDRPTVQFTKLAVGQSCRE